MIGAGVVAECFQGCGCVIGAEGMFGIVLDTVERVVSHWLDRVSFRKQ